MPAAALLLACASCALPVVSAGTFLPAGDLQRGDLHASVSLEAGRVLASPSDVHDLPATPPEARKWEVATWVASDASLRWQALSRLTLEVQAKLSNPVTPFVPALVGGSAGARFRILRRESDKGFSVEIGGRAVGVSVNEQIDRTQDGRSQTDSWNYRALGFELPLIVSYRVNPLFAVTASPFLRAYWIRVWHNEFVGLGKQQFVLQWSPVLTGGLGGAMAFDLGPVQLSPGVAVELATRPGPGGNARLLFEPGISVGTRF